MEIHNKKEMIRLYNKGAFGNKLRTWGSLQALHNSGYKGTVSIRVAGVAGGNLCFYGVQISDVEKVILGNNLDNFYINESAPDDKLLIQGEVMRDVYGRGIAIYYSRLKCPMRSALLAKGESADGIRALGILRTYLTPSSFDDLLELLDTYEGGVIEFSAYGKKLGDCRGRNTIIWEVRNY